jgi:acyl carrier protein
VDRWSAGRDFFNAYGPTETTVCATMELCDPRESGNPPIGRPIANARVYLLDKHLNLTPLGVSGELCVGGVLVARGYWNLPDLTAERFVPDPYGEEAGARLYRTGDLARFLRDGRLEYLGRLDDQVKVRGYRIETGEIEVILREHPAVAEAAVVARDDAGGARQLVAYWVDGPGGSATSSDLRAFLRGKVPEYMVPSLLVKLESMPLTPSGKIDRKALPAPDASQRRGGQVYVAPRTATERVLAQLCGELLGVAEVGVQDNFFDLGGHSLLATQLISRIRREFEIELPLRTLFERPSIEGLAVAIDQARAVEPAALPALQRVSREARRVKRAELDKATDSAPLIARPGGSD